MVLLLSFGEFFFLNSSKGSMPPKSEKRTSFFMITSKINYEHITG